MVIPDAPAILPDGESLAQNLFIAIWNAVYLPWAAGFVLLLTALCKRIPVNVSAPTWVFVWTVVVWAGWVIANQIGYGGFFENIIRGLVTIGSAIVFGAATPLAAGWGYGKVTSQNAVGRPVAIIGYKKS